MNPTFKQLEAFYFSIKLGSFNAAAARLHTTQSAISKRVGELETMLDGLVLHRRPAGLALTSLGHRLLPLATQSIQLRTQIEDLAGTEQTIKGVLRIGVTELIALTWFSRLIQQLHVSHPELRLEPLVESGVTLFRKVESGRLDLAIMAGTYWKNGYTTVRVGQTQDYWMAGAHVCIPNRPLQPAEFANYPVLEQVEDSAKNRFYAAWRAENGFVFGPVFTTNSLVVRREMVACGLGISQMPLDYVRQDIDNGVLKIVRSNPMPPETIYSAVCHEDNRSPAIDLVISKAIELCDFSCRPEYPSAHNDLNPTIPLR
ncbi:LysR family transcriptional regulator [Bordetella genomosp. 4]|uniref:LysR family transcriptional regulator n=1 Tax=Bordetella genomosp. 4 TaxID=463044 RepID=UPI000B9E67EB|nr:LysR family transcriptional regulator [Bordetella genomosp. 4]OZI51210.1 LysR family transcriptional regulator [Bordetella genomosp. 4]